ncbi:MAG TPA: ABC transporter permease [Thermoanaerobaculia bacterium]|nr:ABC transporter permease [Thermoanaerobaculia bacterium]
MTSKALAVFAKEALDAARDRRSVLSALSFALFGPLVLAMALATIAKKSDDNGPLQLTVAGAEHAPSLVRYLEQNGAEIVRASAGVEPAVRRGDLELALVIPKDFGSDFRASRPARVELVHDASRMGSSTPVRRVERLLERYNVQVAGLRLTARGISPQVALPVRLSEIDLSTAASRAAFALATFPIFLLMSAFVGGMSVAIDTTAGERERGSLETLLVHAVPRTDLVVGKWMAAVAFNLLAVLLTLLFSFLVLRWDRLQRMDIPVALSVEDALRLLALLLPLALLAPAVQMLIALFARSFKEAQTQLSLLMLLPMIPGLLLSFQSFEPRPWMRAVPILAEQVVMRDLLYGKVSAPSALALTVGATLTLTVLCLLVTSRLLRHERIVLGR